MNPSLQDGGVCISASDIGLIVQLWENLHQFSALQADEAMNVFLGEVGKLLGSHCGFWLAAASGKEFAESMKTDLYEGYEAVDLIAMPTGLDHEEVCNRHQRYSELSMKHGVCPLAVESMRNRGQIRAVMRHDLMDDETWHKEWVHREFYLPNEIGDRIVALYPVDATSESCLVFDRKLGEPYFTARDREILRLSVAGVGQLHRELMLIRGGVANTNRLLTARERDVLKRVLTGDTEKEIAEQMGLGRSTLHHHVISIYRKYNVRNRSGLQALWSRF